MSPVVSNVETKYIVKIIDEKIQGVTIQKTLLTMTDKEGIKVPLPMLDTQVFLLGVLEHNSAPNFWGKMEIFIDYN